MHCPCVPSSYCPISPYPTPTPIALKPHNPRAHFHDGCMSTRVHVGCPEHIHEPYLVAVAQQVIGDALHLPRPSCGPKQRLAIGADLAHNLADLGVGHALKAQWQLGVSG